ncbi:hypothetical protein [Streptomyces sp. NPDC055681]
MTDPATYTTRRLILKEWGTEDEVLEFASQGNFELLRDETHEIALGITRNVVWRVAPGVVLQYAVDTRSHSSVFALSGTPAETVQRFQESIEDNLLPWTLKDLLTAVDRAKDPEEFIRAVLRAGMGAPREFDKKFSKRFKKAAQSRDPDVRSAGMWAISYSRWEEFRELLGEISRKDPEESLRREAQIILNHYDED